MRKMMPGSKAEIVAEGTALLKGTVGIVAADDSAGVTLRVGGANVTVPKSALVHVCDACETDWCRCRYCGAECSGCNCKADE
jgi:hypothetical protein